MFAEQSREPAETGDLGAVQAEAARHLREVAAAVRRVHRVDAVGAEFVGLGAVAAIVDDADQQLDAVAPDRLQLLDVLYRLPSPSISSTLPLSRAAATPIAAGRPEPMAPKSIGMWYLLGRAAAQMRHGEAEAVAAADHDVPVLRDRRVELDDRRARIDRAGGRRVGSSGPGFRPSRRSARRFRCCASPARRMPRCLQPRDDRLGRGPGIGLDMQIGGAQPLPQAARVECRSAPPCASGNR